MKKHELMRSLIQDAHVACTHNYYELDEGMLNELADVCCRLNDFYNKYKDEPVYDDIRKVMLYDNLGRHGFAFSENSYLEDIARCFYRKELEHE